MTVRLDITVSGCDTDDRTDEVLLLLKQKLEDLTEWYDMHYHSGDLDRSFKSGIDSQSGWPR